MYINKCCTRVHLADQYFIIMTVAIAAMTTMMMNCFIRWKIAASGECVSVCACACAASSQAVTQQ